MSDSAPDLSERIARRVCDLRAARRLSLDALATRSGVSRSMISLVERGESSPTASVLERLASGLSVTLASLFVDQAAPVLETSQGPVSRREDQPEWRDPASGYVRRNVSPSGSGEPQPMQIVEVHFPPRGRVAFDNGARDLLVHQQVWVLDGAMDVSVGEERHRLRKGDCLAMVLDRPTTFHNPTRKSARYAVVVLSEARPPRSLRSRQRGSG
jgi:transcriptional regulator with XRE-family HTH domain